MPTPQDPPESGPESGPSRPRSFFKYLFAAAGLFVFIQAFPRLSPILLSLLLILLISLAVNPVILRLRALTGGRRLATGLVTGGFVIAAVLTGWAFFGPIKSSTTKLAERLPEYWERLQKPLIRMEKQAQISEQKLQDEVTNEVVRQAEAVGEHQTAQRAVETPPKPAAESSSFRTGLTQMMQDVAGSFAKVAFNATEIFVVLLTVFFGVTFTLANPRPIFGVIFGIVPEYHHERALVIMQRIGNFVPSWALATFLGMLTIGVLVTLLMWPLFGLGDALLLGVIAGILEAIPYVGPLVSALPALLFAAGEGGMTPVWVIVAYIAVQTLENNVIAPLIVARSMKLHPLAVIVSMLLCVTAFGVLGVLVAPPMVAIIKILHDEIYRKRFLPHTDDDGIDALARRALMERRT